MSDKLKKHAATSTTHICCLWVLMWWKQEGSVCKGLSRCQLHLIINKYILCISVLFCFYQNSPTLADSVLILTEIQIQFYMKGGKVTETSSIIQDFKTEIKI